MLFPSMRPRPNIEYGDDVGCELDTPGSKIMNISANKYILTSLPIKDANR
jgi:hypothetical protein